MILVDTSVFGRLTNGKSNHRAPATRAIQYALRKSKPAVAAQTLYEFWVVATRPVASNGLGWSASRTSAWLTALKRVCQFIPEDPRCFDQWLLLVSRHNTMGKPAHDARLVAVMQIYNISEIITFNVSDFQRYGITVTDPLTL